MAMPTPLTTKMTAPNFSATTAVWNAMITPIRKPISSTMGTAFAPASVATATTSPQRIVRGRRSECQHCCRAFADERSHGGHVGEHVRGPTAKVLGDAHRRGFAILLSEVFRVVAFDQRGEVRRQVHDRDLGTLRPLPPAQIEQQRDAGIIHVVEAGGVDDDAPVRIARQGLERGPPDRRHRVGGDPALQDEGGGICAGRGGGHDSNLEPGKWRRSVEARYDLPGRQYTHGTGGCAEAMDCPSRPADARRRGIVGP